MKKETIIKFRRRKTKNGPLSPQILNVPETTQKNPINTTKSTLATLKEDNKEVNKKTITPKTNLLFI